MRQQCGSCHYWTEFDQQLKGHNDDKPLEETHKGWCHRNAPQASLGDWHYQAIKQLAIIAKTVSDDDEWEEAQINGSVWPATYKEEWCGEWKQRDESIERGRYDDDIEAMISQAGD